MQEYMKTLSISELQLPARVYLKLMRDNVTTLEKLANCDIFKYNYSKFDIEDIQHCFREYTGEPLNIMTKQPEPQHSVIQSEEHIKAVALHQKILTSAELAQKNLWDMCTSLKEMRDSKLYKELGYSNFEDYCENEVGMTRVNAYRYITVVEKVKLENVTSMLQIGMTKLSLLATISQEQQAEISQRVDLENTTVKKLKEEIDKLKKEAEAAKFHEENIREAYSHLEKTNEKHYRNFSSEQEKNRKLEQQNINLQKQIKELESRPVEVAVLEPEPSDNERLLQETIRNLQIESQKRDEELECQYREDEKAVRQMLERQKQDALQQLTEEYEEKIEKLSASSEAHNKELEIFDALMQSADKLISQMVDIAIKDKDNRKAYAEKLNRFFSSSYERIFIGK